MRRLIHLSGLLLCLCLGCLVQAGEVLTQQFPSRILGRDYRYMVYLPKGYATAAERFPVLYLLHGAAGDEREWLDNGKLLAAMDSLIDGGEIAPMVVVMPGHPQGWWVDGTRDKGETALLNELLPHAESHFRVDAEPGLRLLGGISAGGYGALNLVLKYPERFAAAALLSPAVYDPLPPVHSSARQLPPFQSDGHFDPQRWRGLNYVAHLESYKNSKIVVPLFIHCGDHDNLGIALQSALLFERLRLHQPGAIALHIVDGDHDWTLWRDALPEALLFLNAHRTLRLTDRRKPH